MRYCILGTTRALRDDGTAVPLGGARLRALLTVLALRPGRTVPAGVLVDEVWDGDPPADATGALQALVGRARRALGRSAVESVEGGYRLAAPPDAVDLHRFERLAGEGSRALEDGDASSALALLGEALALWHGPALADLPDRAAEASRWEARRLDARRAGLGALLALGRAGEALPELAVLCDAHPLDEPLQVLRITALRDAGRPAEALAAYEEVRTLLDDRLGTAPGPGLRALHTELLHQEPAAPPPPGPAPRPTRGTPPAVGAALSPAAPAPAPAPPGNLRARLTSFVGRDSDIAALRDDLARSRLVTLLGPGGAGKTRLSQETAEAAAESWPDGVWLAELAPVDDPDSVPEAVLSALGARETVLRGAGAEELRATDRTGADPLVRLTEHCAPRRMLLLLDNCEHVVEAAAALAERLLTHCPQLTVLATSREPLGVPGEFVRPVDPLPDPMALRLLAERGAAARPGFRTDADGATAAACAEICRRLDGLPLAIELAAARLRMLTPRQIADRLDDRFRLLTNGSRTVLPRQQTLRAVVDWSWDLLDVAERAVLRRLSVFAGGCSLAAAEEVCALPASADGVAVDSLDVAALLGSLVDKSLVVAVPGDDEEMRYRLLETVGEYAAERLEEAAERDAVERRHLVHYRELARITGPRMRGFGQREAIAVFRREYENIRTALRHAVAARDEHEALCIVLSLAWYWMLRDLRSDARQWSELAASLGPDPFAPPGVLAPVLMEGPTDRPPPMDDEQLAEARRGVALIQLAGVDNAISQWSTPEGKARLQIIADTYRPGMPQTCRMPGTFWLFAVMLTGDMDRLFAVLDETVRASRVHGGEWELGSALHTRANLLSNSPERVADARADADESLEIYTRLGDDWGAAEALSARGEANERAGDFLAALDDYRAAVEYARKIGAQSQAALLWARYAGALIELDRLPEAETILRDVTENGREVGHEATPMARMHLGFVLGLQGRVDEARREAELVREDFRSRDVAIFGGFVYGVLAWLDNLDGAHASALDNALIALESALEPLSMMVAPQMPSAHLTAIAHALAGFGDARAAQDAARLLAFQATLLPKGHVPSVMEHRSLVLAEQAARDRLDDDAAFAAAYAEGGGLTLDEATALAETYRRSPPA
ncbi:BTAD domain-containing putative transcriptional regulator [Streptomyces sp. CA-278952]|uniref:AfsR/SARP family transcriptional regulator n=1 Tax=unclassified Streptomyces TaxID=2593676 RepID=UPI002242464E|nr:MULTISPECIES: BTAD domain-containing putative transcriptional regulator [unclassified Streptomyces]UZI31639.1 AAA family ATPase [Streptomyces sp. VB1]WDG31688.1 BTAD domain-containing putative transcriptional regulator [Streptomyces sp. CA-278952]